MGDKEIKKFNLFRNLGLNENQHSNLLKKLLHSKGSHHQGNLFLIEFLKMLNMDLSILSANNIQIGKEQKAGKKGRVDLLISIDDYKIVLENKINGAKNQRNQLYRYWKNLIFNHSEYKNYCNEQNIQIYDDLSVYNDFYQLEQFKNKFKLIYLTKSTKGTNESDTEFEQSKQKPQNPTYNDLTHLPKEIPMTITRLGYKEDIVPWLESCLLKVSENENCSKANLDRLKIVLEQYIEEIKN